MASEPPTTLKQAWEQGFHALDDAVNPYEDDDADEGVSTVGLIVVWLIIAMIIGAAALAGYFDWGGVE
jgi:hypothetical protein